MNIEAAIHDGPLPGAGSWHVPGAGAVVCFEGVVRPSEQDRAITGLRYETYDPMAEHELRRLAQQAFDRFGLLGVRVQHSRGFVPSHRCSFRLQLASAHRKQGLAAMDWFIDHMKQVTPIWKRPIGVDNPLGDRP